MNNDKVFAVKKSRHQYTKMQLAELDALKKLDAWVKRPVKVFGYTFGSLGTAITGVGVSLVVKNIAYKLGLKDGILPGAAIGAIGILMMYANYPIYESILDLRKQNFSDSIFKLNEKLINKGENKNG